MFLVCMCNCFCVVEHMKCPYALHALMYALPAGTSVGLLGLGGYCTGKIMAINAASTLHPTGQALLGYPCIEHTGPVLDLLPVISNTQKGD